MIHASPPLPLLAYRCLSYLTIDGIESLEAIEQFIEQEFRLFMQRADEGVPLVEPQQHVHAPLQLRVPHVKGRHALKKRHILYCCLGLGGSCLCAVKFSMMAFCVITFSMMAFRVMTLSVTISIRQLIIIPLSLEEKYILLSFNFPIVISNFNECRFSMGYYVECHGFVV